MPFTKIPAKRIREIAFGLKSNSIRIFSLLMDFVEGNHFILNYGKSIRLSIFVLVGQFCLLFVLLLYVLFPVY